MTSCRTCSYCVFMGICVHSEHIYWKGTKSYNLLILFCYILCLSWNTSKYHKLSLKHFLGRHLFFRNCLLETKGQLGQTLWRSGNGKSRWQWLVEGSVRTEAGKCPEFALLRHWLPDCNIRKNDVSFRSSDNVLRI